MDKIKASIDRFEEGFAIAYSDGGEKIDIPMSIIPKDVLGGSRVTISFRHQKIVSVKLDKGQTDELEKKIKDKLERLKRGEHL